MPTPLQLSGYFIDRLKVEVNPKFDGRQVYVFDLEVEPDAARHTTDPMKHQLTLKVTFGRAKGDPKGTPYVGYIVGRGLFALEPNDLSEDDQTSLVLLNGSAILLGLLRAQVASVTALACHRTFLLPPVNLVEAFRARAAALEAVAVAEPEAEH